MLSNITAYLALCERVDDDLADGPGPHKGEHLQHQQETVEQVVHEERLVNHVEDLHRRRVDDPAHTSNGQPPVNFYTLTASPTLNSNLPYDVHHPMNAIIYGSPLFIMLL